ncbi:MAG: hypothetical protein ABL895_18240 [Cyclobacteriaceae bacterium]
MSHVKNVQAFGKLTGICTGYGGTYNPGQQNLQVNAMITLLNSAQQAMEAVNEAQAFYDSATNNRELGFKGLRKFSSSVCSILKASGVTDLTMKDARSSCRKIWGGRPRRKAMAESQPGEDKTKGSFSYAQDYASVSNYFGMLVETVGGEPLYQPTEPELKVKGLEQKLAQLRSLNEAVTKAEIQLTQARRNRDNLYYKKEGNLFVTARAAKEYVRGIFGFESSQHVEVRRLRFTKPIS